MPRTPKPPAEKLAPVPAEILDHFAPDRPLTASEIDAATRRLTKALMERVPGAELTHHLGYPAGGAGPGEATHHRNGTTGETVLTDDGPVAIAVPRDRAVTFEPQFIPTHV